MVSELTMGFDLQGNALLMSSNTSLAAQGCGWLAAQLRKDFQIKPATSLLSEMESPCFFFSERKKVSCLTFFWRRGGILSISPCKRTSGCAALAMTWSRLIRISLSLCVLLWSEFPGKKKWSGNVLTPSMWDSTRLWNSISGSNNGKKKFKKLLFQGT